MSDVSQGPGWWLASDGKWYPPEEVPDYGAAAQTSGAPVAPPYGPPPAAPGYAATPPAPGYPPPNAPPGYGAPAGVPYGYAPAGPYGYTAAPKTNGLAIASLICSFFFWIYGIGAILSIVFGFIARSQIKRSGNTQKGSGLALAGIIIGISGIVLFLVGILVLVNHCSHTGSCQFHSNFNDNNN